MSKRKPVKAKRQLLTVTMPTEDEYEDVRVLAAQAGVNMSTLVRGLLATAIVRGVEVGADSVIAIKPLSQRDGADSGPEHTRELQIIVQGKTIVSTQVAGMVHITNQGDQR